MEMEPKKSPSALLQYLATASGTLAIMTDAMHYGWPSPSLPQLVNSTDSTLSLTSSQGSWLAVMPLLGATCGALTAANIVDCFGRKKTIMATTVPFFIAWIMIGFATRLFELFLARFIAGVADGVTFIVVPMYIGEIASPEIRGILGSSCSVMWIIGFLLINTIGSYLSISITALVASLIPMICLVTFIWMPESPYYLIMKGRKEEAHRSLCRLRNMEDVSTEVEKISESIQAKSQNSGRFLELFTVKSNIKGLLIIAGLRGFQQFSGTTAITFYAQDIFNQSSHNLSPHHSSMIYFGAQLIMTMISSSIVDRTGRKPLMIVSITGSAFALFLEATYFYIQSETKIDTSKFDFLPIIFLIGFIIIFSLGMQSVPLILLGELFPTNVKAYALCLADLYFSVVVTIVSKFLQIMRDNYGIFVPFYGFTMFCLFGLVFIVLCVPETKGKSLEEIQEMLKDGSNLKNKKTECTPL